MLHSVSPRPHSSVVYLDFLPSAHAQACERGVALHRDVSAGNIMIKGTNGVVEGFLIDWDLCIEIGKDYNEVDATPERTVSIQTTLITQLVFTI